MIREKIKEAMNIRGIKASDLAEQIGITKSPMSQFLNGKIGLKHEKLEAIMEYLRIKLVIED